MMIVDCQAGTRGFLYFFYGIMPRVALHGPLQVPSSTVEVLHPTATMSKDVTLSSSPARPQAGGKGYATYGWGSSCIGVLGKEYWTLTRQRSEMVLRMQQTSYTTRTST